MPIVSVSSFCSGGGGYSRRNGTNLYLLMGRIFFPVRAGLFLYGIVLYCILLGEGVKRVNALDKGFGLKECEFFSVSKFFFSNDDKTGDVVGGDLEMPMATT